MYIWLITLYFRAPSFLTWTCLNLSMLKYRKKQCSNIVLLRNWIARIIYFSDFIESIDLVGTDLVWFSLIWSIWHSLTDSRYWIDFIYFDFDMLFVTSIDELNLILLDWVDPIDTIDVDWMYWFAWFYWAVSLNSVWLIWLIVPQWGLPQSGSYSVQ